MLSRNEARKLMPPVQEQDYEAFNNICNECIKRIETHAR